MALLKNTIFIALLLLFSLKFAKSQTGWDENNEMTPTEEWYPPTQEEATWECPTEETHVEETRIEETVTIEETYFEETRTEETCAEEASWEESPWNEAPWEETHVEEIHVEETRTEETRNEETCYEEIPTEEAPIEEIIVEEEEEGSAGECPRFIEETEVNGHWMTFHPCCVGSEAVCSRSYQPVCLEELRCEVDHCRRHYETVTNVCLACKGEGSLMYSLGECPWEKNAF